MLKSSSKSLSGVRVLLAVALVVLFGALGVGQAAAAGAKGRCSSSQDANYYMSFDFTTESSGVAGFGFYLGSTRKIGNKNNVDMHFYGRYGDGHVSSLGYWESGDNIRGESKYSIDYRKNLGSDVKEVWAVFHGVFDRPILPDLQCWGETAHVHRLRAPDSQG